MSTRDYDERPPEYSGYPPGFADWPLDVKITHVSNRFKRAGLQAALLSHAGLDPQEYSLSDDYKMRKEELAAIYILVEGLNDDS